MKFSKIIVSACFSVLSFSASAGLLGSVSNAISPVVAANAVEEQSGTRAAGFLLMAVTLADGVPVATVASNMVDLSDFDCPVSSCTLLSESSASASDSTGIVYYSDRALPHTSQNVYNIEGSDWRLTRTFRIDQGDSGLPIIGSPIGPSGPFKDLRDLLSENLQQVETIYADVAYILITAASPVLDDTVVLQTLSNTVRDTTCTATGDSDTSTCVDLNVHVPDGVAYFADTFDTAYEVIDVAEVENELSLDLRQAILRPGSDEGLPIIGSPIGPSGPFKDTLQAVINEVDRIVSGG
ncbi:MAG: hypothetical protein ACSHXK_14015 [Oceanococcus sp.]